MSIKISGSGSQIKIKGTGLNGIKFKPPGPGLGGLVIDYTLGAGGAGGTGENDGASGGASTLSFMGVDMTASGGAGGLFNSSTTAAGGSATGGSVNVTGGAGASVNRINGGNQYGGGGGGIGASDAVIYYVGTLGGRGAGPIHAGNLSTALSFLTSTVGKDYLEVARSGEQQLPASTSGQNAPGFGGGGGGAFYTGGHGGAGRYGGGGGGASADNSGSYNGGAGGDGVLVLALTSASGDSYQILTSGTSYTLPAGTLGVKAWLVGGGGGGAGVGSTYNTAGGGGGAGGTCVSSWGDAWSGDSIPADPSIISGLRMWLRSDYGLYKDVECTQPAVSASDRVAVWKSRANGTSAQVYNNLNYGTAGSLDTSNATFNNRPTVHFPGAAKLGLNYDTTTKGSMKFDPALYGDGAYEYSQHQFTIVVVWSISNVSTVDGSFPYNLVAGALGTPSFYVDTGLGKVATWNGGNGAYSNASASANKAYAQILMQDKHATNIGGVWTAGATTDMMHMLNGTVQSGNPDPRSSPIDWDQMFVGPGFGNSTLAPVDIVEFMVFSKALTSSERNAVNAYLKSRYAISDIP